MKTIVINCNDFVTFERQCSKLKKTTENGGRYFRNAVVIEHKLGNITAG